MISARCVARDLYTIVPGPLERTCWRQFAALWGDCKKSRIAPLNAIIIILLLFDMAVDLVMKTFILQNKIFLVYSTAGTLRISTLWRCLSKGLFQHKDNHIPTLGCSTGWRELWKECTWIRLTRKTDEIFFFCCFLRSPAISLGFTTLGEIFAYVTVFLIQPLR